MKLTELDVPITIRRRRAPADADSIYVARLPKDGVGTAPERAPADSEKSAITQPVPLLFVAPEARHPHFSSRVALLLVLVVMAAFLAVLIGSSATGSASAPRRKAHVHLTPAQAAARKRAAAIAKFKRDRGTDAQWGDPSPPATR